MTVTYYARNLILYHLQDHFTLSKFRCSVVLFRVHTFIFAKDQSWLSCQVTSPKLQLWLYKCQAFFYLPDKHTCKNSLTSFNNFYTSTHMVTLGLSLLGLTSSADTHFSFNLYIFFEQYVPKTLIIWL